MPTISGAPPKLKNVPSGTPSTRKPSSSGTTHVERTTPRPTSRTGSTTTRQTTSKTTKHPTSSPQPKTKRGAPAAKPREFKSFRNIPLVWPTLFSLNRTSNKSKETFITMGLGVNGCLNYIEYNLNHATELYLFKHFYIFVFSDNRFFFCPVSPCLIIYLYKNVENISHYRFEQVWMLTKTVWRFVRFIIQHSYFTLNEQALTAQKEIIKTMIVTSITWALLCKMNQSIENTFRRRMKVEVVMWKTKNMHSFLHVITTCI